MDYAEVSNTFVRLADTHFVQRCPLVPATENSDPGPPPPAPTLVISEKDMYLVPKLSLIGKEFWPLDRSLSLLLTVKVMLLLPCSYLRVSEPPSRKLKVK